MTTIYKEVNIDAPLNKIWESISDTANIADLVGFLATSNQTDDTRVCTLEGGGELKEKIVSVDDDLKRVAYTITESPLNMEYHSASMQLEETEDGTKLVWTVDLLPEAAKQQMGPMLEQACIDVKSSFAN